MVETIQRRAGYRIRTLHAGMMPVWGSVHHLGVCQLHGATGITAASLHAAVTVIAANIFAVMR